MCWKVKEPVRCSLPEARSLRTAGVRVGQCCPSSLRLEALKLFGQLLLGVHVVRLRRLESKLPSEQTLAQKKWSTHELLAFSSVSIHCVPSMVGGPVALMTGPSSLVAFSYGSLPRKLSWLHPEVCFTSRRHVFMQQAQNQDYSS